MDKYREQAPLPELETKIIECASEEEAKKQAAEFWGIDTEDVTTEVLSEDKKLFGLLGSNLRIEAKPIAPVSYIKSCYFANEILAKMGVDLVPELDNEGMVTLVGEDQSIIIGRYGETLKALEYLANLVCHDDFSTRRIRFDCGGYREKRTNTLTRLALSIAREVAETGESKTLEPMTSWERRIIHIALRDNNTVDTRSVGEDPMRRVVISPVGSGRRRPRVSRHR